MIDKLKVATTDTEKHELLSQYLDSDLDKETNDYIQSREDLTEIMKSLKSKHSKSLKSLLDDIDDYNRQYHPDLVPKDPNSMEERIELQKKHRFK